MPDIKATAAQFERDQPRQVEDSIQSSNFGGLNTTANPINCPYTDSPFLINTSVDISGNINKRNGTRQLAQTVGAVQSASMMPFTTGLGYNHVVLKNGVNIEVYEIINDISTRIMLKSNVWNTAAQFIKPSFVRTSEVEPRLLMMTGVNKPVQLKFAEQQLPITVGSLTTSVAVNDTLKRFIQASTSNMLVYVDRVRQPSATLSYNAGTNVLTVGNLALQPGSHVVDIALVTWAWWAEAMRWQGNRFFQVTNRNNASIADLSIPIPLFVRTDINPLKLGTNSFNIIAYSAAQLPNGYSNPNTNQPTTNVQYGFSDGGTYTPAVAQALNPSNLYITFGALLGSTSLPLYWIRRRELRLNNNQPILPTNLDVYVDKVKHGQVYTGSANVAQDYFLFSDNSTGNAVTILDQVTPAIYMSFEFSSAGAVSIGVNYSSFVEAINSNNTTHIGSSTVKERNPYKDGCYVPAYGLGLFADYLNGYYPRQVALYQGRLVLGGFPHIPLTVLFSEVADTTIPGTFYSFFQVTNDLSGVPSDPFDVIISSTPEDRVVSFQEWQGNLFCFTRKSVFRIYGINQPLSATSNAVNLVSNMGLVNEQCVATTETSLMYLSDFGVFDLVPYTLYGEYQVREHSLKIRTEFGLTLNPNYETLPFLKYDQTRRAVYLGYPVVGEVYTCRRLFVYSTFRESWTEYDTPGAFQSFSASTYVDRALGTFFGMLCTRYRVAGVPNDITFIRFDDVRLVDFRVIVTAVGGTTSLPVNTPPVLTFTTSGGQHVYSYLFQNNGQTSSFVATPLTNVQDMSVTLNGVPLVFQVDYQKLPNDSIYLLADPGTGNTLVITARRPIADSPEGQAFYGLSSPIDADVNVVYLDSVLQTPNLYPAVNGGGFYTIVVPTLVSQVVEVGQAFLTLYSTPLFDSQSIATNKRLTHIVAYMSNADAETFYNSSSVNTLDAQPASQIVDNRTTRLNASFLVAYSSNSDADISYDIYGYRSLVWDDTSFDIQPSARSYEQYQLFKQPIIGTGYSIQFFIMNYDDSAFSLAAYQILVAPKGRRVLTRY